MEIRSYANAEAGISAHAALGETLEEKRKIFRSDINSIEIPSNVAM
jgi:hypothetical protein